MNFKELVIFITKGFKMSVLTMSGLHSIKSGTTDWLENGKAFENVDNVDDFKEDSEQVLKEVDCYSVLCSQFMSLCFSFTSLLDLHHEQKCSKIQTSPLLLCSQ